MVQGISAQTNNSFGVVNRIGNTPDGRVVYQVIDAEGKEAGKLSLPAQECDVFEKSYKDIMEAAPKIQKFAQQHSSPEDVRKRRNISRTIICFGTAIGAAIPIYLTRNATTAKQIIATSIGILSGLAGGFGLSLATTTPPGTIKFSKATKNLSKLDIQPVVDNKVVV